MNATSFTTFFPKHATTKWYTFLEKLFVSFKLVPDLKEHNIYEASCIHI